MNKWKRYSAIALSAVMGIGILSGCAGSKGSENDDSTSGKAKNTDNLATVSVYMPAALNFTEEGIASVEDKMNKILAERYGVQIDLNYIDLGNWTTQTNLALTTDECDIVTLLNTPLINFVNNGQLLPLTEYYENGSEKLKATFSDEEIEATSFEGELYSLPRIYWGGSEQVLNMSKNIVEEMGIDPSTINSIEAVDKLLYEVKEKYPDIHVLVPETGNSIFNTWYFGDGISDEKGRYGMLPIFDSDFDESNMKVESLFETEAFREVCDYAYKWYQDGLILTDVLSNTIPGSTYIANGQAFAYFGVYCGNGYVTLEQDVPEVLSANLGPSMSYSYSHTSISWGINSNSKHPDEAWEVLQALYTDEDLATLLMAGVEDEDYVYLDNGLISLPEGVDTSQTAYGGLYQYWAYPNTVLPPASDLVGKGYAENVQAYNEALEESPIIGFKWDSSDCTDEMTAVSNVYDQYYSALLSGLLNPEETIPQVSKELKQAGIDKILESQQKQLDLFLKSR